MVDIRPYMNQKLHVIVNLTGKCKKCNKTFNEKIHDYGELPFRELEKQMDKTNHVLKKIECKSCLTENIPEFVVYKDLIRNVVISNFPINYSGEIDDKKAQIMNEAHEKRFELFKEKEDKFWENYIDTAIVKWRDFVNELNDFEIKDGFRKMNIKSRSNTIGQLRKEVLQRFKTVKEKQEFWKYANEYFIYEHLLDIGAMGWHVEADIKAFGTNRMRFIILYFPLHESYEDMRTEWIGKVIKKSRGDNDFLFRRISMITSELNRVRQKINKYVHTIEMLKIEKSELEKKLSKSYDDLRIFREQAKSMNIKRDPYDVQKINELKSFVSELINELKEKQKIIEELKPVDKIEEKTLEEEVDKEEIENYNIIQNLKGKTVFIIGGNRKEQADNEYPCKVLTHEGILSDPEFYRMLKQADILVILTQFISHIVMWEVKSYAIENDIPIHFVKGLNIPKILTEIAEKE